MSNFHLQTVQTRYPEEKKYVLIFYYGNLLVKRIRYIDTGSHYKGCRYEMFNPDHEKSEIFRINSQNRH